MILRILLVLILGVTSPPTEQWQCQNDVEIRCDAAGCDVATEGDFTPMQVQVNDAGFMQVCAYSGCWEGTGTVVKNTEFVMFAGHDLPFSTAPDVAEQRESMVIAIDRTDQVGLLKVGAFAHPLQCEQVTAE